MTTTICPRCETEHDEHGRVECIYCNRWVPCAPVPDVDDDAAWEDAAEAHLDTCEWVQTRAHRLP